MKNFKIMLSVFMVILILSVSIAPAFAENEYNFESAEKQEEIAPSEDYEIITDELSEGPYNNDEKIFCTATIEDDFDDDSLLVVMKNEASLNLEDYSTPQFEEIDAKKVEELTSYKTEEMRSEFQSKKAEFTTALKNAVSSNNNVSRSVFSTANGGTLTAVDNKIIEKNATALSVAEIKREYNDFHKIMYIELDTKDKQNVLDTIKELEKNEDVLAVDPNYYLQPASTSTNDTEFSKQWALDSANIKAAWDITTGSSTVKVGVIDDGIDADHPDLSDNYDDTLSISFTDNKPYESLDGHGTAVAGVIGAVGNNNEGIAGVCWNVKLVSLKVFSPSDGKPYLCHVISAIQYAQQHNIDILNLSSAYEDISTTFNTTVNEYDGIIICGAGNEAWDLDSEDCTAEYQYPSLWDSAKIISVASIDSNDDLAWDSNYGVDSVDLAAPGYKVYSAVNEGNTLYNEVYGTSFAAPYVTGVAALIKSKYPDITYRGIRKAILTGVTKISELDQKVVTEGKLNAYKALNNVEKIKYTIKYDANGGTGTMADTRMTYGFYTNLRNVAYTKELHNFIGWEVYKVRDNTSDDKYYYYTNGSTKRWFAENSEPTEYKKVVYANQTPIGHLSQTNDEVITMSAKWEIYSYDIEFLGNGADGYSYVQKCNFNTMVDLMEVGYDMPGYSFDGWKAYKYAQDNSVLWLYACDGNYAWYTDSSQPTGYDIVRFEDCDSVVNLSNIDREKLYFLAQWNLINYNINYDANGGYGEMEDTIGNITQIVHLRSNTFTKAHNKFVGWHIKDNLGQWSTTFNNSWWSVIPEGYEKKLYEDGTVLNYAAEHKDVELTAVAQWLLLGDVDLDGEISVMDATLIQQYFVRVITLTEEQISRGDFNEDGVFDITDATAIRQYLISGNQ